MIFCSKASTEPPSSTVKLRRAVVLVSAPAAASLMVRGVLYTAITRARELLVMVGDDVIPGKMAENDRQARRYSGLRRRLMQGGGSDGASG